MRDSVEISVEICREGVQLPAYAKEGDAGMDVRAAEPVEIKPRETVLIPTGLKVAIPDGYEIQVRPRSGLSLKTPLRLAMKSVLLYRIHRRKCRIKSKRVTESHSSYCKRYPKFFLKR